jgi:hypothetical protein
MLCQKKIQEVVPEKDKWFEEALEPRTDWVDAYEKRFLYVGRYTYLFNKPREQLEPFEIALKWFLQFKHYQGVWTKEYNAITEKHMKECEDCVDRILESIGIPLRFVDDMRRMTSPPRHFEEYHPNCLEDGTCLKCGEMYVWCGCETEVRYVEVDRNGKEV